MSREARGVADRPPWAPCRASSTWRAGGTRRTRRLSWPPSRLRRSARPTERVSLSRWGCCARLSRPALRRTPSPRSSRSRLRAGSTPWAGAAAGVRGGAGTTRSPRRSGRSPAPSSRPCGSAPLIGRRRAAPPRPAAQPRRRRRTPPHRSAARPLGMVANDPRRRRPRAKPGRRPLAPKAARATSRRRPRPRAGGSQAPAGQPRLCGLGALP
mmetsp:Transcript_15058/g.44909  ORF Transcript_15058/g.44909 Transcript_15058/m.44909 type:complete len:212 (-) Transcript_15058:384-1019(-)